MLCAVRLLEAEEREDANVRIAAERLPWLATRLCMRPVAGAEGWGWGLASFKQACEAGHREELARLGKPDSQLDKLMACRLSRD